MLEEIVADIAARACTEHDGDSESPTRSIYQHGRALMAKADFSGAKRDFERALASGHRAAAVDLGMLLTRPSAAMLDIPKAISLYEQAWKSGLTIAAFELGDLYEHGVRRGGSDSGYLLVPDQATAWSWYRKGADAGEPTALARFGAEEDRAAFAAERPAGRTAHLLGAFRYYASAAERARLEDWPDSAWRDWRYRRASIARVLAREGAMEEVAREYGDVRKRYAPHPTAWQRFASSMGLE